MPALPANAPRILFAVLLLPSAGCLAMQPGGVENLDRLQEICAGPVPARSRVEVVTLSPAAGAPIDKQTVVRAKLDYAIPPAFAGDCLLAAQFVLRKGGTTLSTWKDQTARPELARGTVALAIPLGPQLGNPELARPLQMRFVVQNLKGGSIIAETDFVTYGGGGEAAPPAPSVTVRSLYPAPDETLTPATVVEALVAYTVPDFGSARYEIRAQLTAIKPGNTLLPGGETMRAEVTAASGSAVLRLPLADLLQTGGSRRPLELSFVLAKLDGDTSWLLAESPVATYDFCKVVGTPPQQPH